MNKISFSKLQREAISIYKRLSNGDKSLHQFKKGGETIGIRSEKFPNIHILYLFDFSKENKQNYIAIVYSAYSKFSGNFELVKRVDFKYKKGLK